MSTETPADHRDDAVEVRAMPLPWGDHDAALKVLEHLEQEVVARGDDKTQRSGRSRLTHIVCSDLVSVFLLALLHSFTPV